MGGELEKLKKLKGRSLREIQTRGQQLLSTYAEQIGWAGKILSDEDFLKQTEPQMFDDEEVSAESWLKIFQRRNGENFFLAFADRELTLKSYLLDFGEGNRKAVIAKAEKYLDGKFDLLGFGEFDLGVPIDWLREPRTGGEFSVEYHWAEMNGAMHGKVGENRLMFELNRHQHFFTLGQAYWLTGDERYAVAFIMQICGWMQQNPPQMGVNWASSLEVSFRSISWLWALHFFKNSPNLTPSIFLSIVKYLQLHGRHLETHLSTYFSPDNHLTGEALGLYYLGTLLPELKRAAVWKEKGREILISEIGRQVLNDGTYFGRSIYYHRYTTDFYLHFLLLSRINQEKIGNEAENKIIGLLEFLMHATRPDGSTPLIGDDDGGKMLPVTNNLSDDFRGTLATGAVIFGRNDFKFVAGDQTEEMFWLLGAEGMRKFKRLEPLAPQVTSRDFTDGGFYISRDSWNKDSDFLLINTGKSTAESFPHSHCDALSFDLAVQGRTILNDIGTFSFYENSSARNYFRTTAAHNTLVIDEDSASIPAETFSWFTTAQTTIHNRLTNSRFAFLEGSHDGYQNLPEEALHRRDFLHLKKDYLIIRDFVETTGNHRYDLNFHFAPDAEPAIETGEAGIRAISEKPADEPGIEIFTFGDNGLWSEQADFVSTEYGEKVPASTCRFTSVGNGSQEFYTFILPNNRAVLPTAFEFAAKNGRAFSICYENTEDMLMINDGEGEMTRTDLFQSDFKFAWARFVGEENPVLDELILIGGSRLIFDGRDIVNHPHRISFAMARRVKNNLNVITDDAGYSVSLPNPHRQKPRVYVMRNPKKDSRKWKGGS